MTTNKGGATACQSADRVFCVFCWYP